MEMKLFPIAPSIDAWYMRWGGKRRVPGDDKSRQREESCERNWPAFPITVQNLMKLFAGHRVQREVCFIQH